MPTIPRVGRVPINAAHPWCVRSAGEQGAVTVLCLPAGPGLQALLNRRCRTHLALPSQRGERGRDGRKGRARSALLPPLGWGSVYPSPTAMETIAHRPRPRSPPSGSRPPTLGDRTAHPPSRRAAANPHPRPCPPPRSPGTRRAAPPRSRLHPARFRGPPGIAPPGSGARYT